MSKTVITSCVRNVRTVPMLMQYTDRLYRSGLLSGLRLVDCTNNPDSAIDLRKLCFVDNNMGSVMLDLDHQKILNLDQGSVIASNVSGYRHRQSGISLYPGDSPISFFIKGGGGSIGLNRWEIVIQHDRCFVRTGKGGGSIISEIIESSTISVADAPGAWKFVSISWDGSKVKVNLTSEKYLEFNSPEDWSSADITFSSLKADSVDFIITRTSIFDLQVSESKVRSYVSYHTSVPNILEGDNVEIFSNDDIVYIDVDGWKNLVSGDGLAVSVGDAAHSRIFREMGLSLVFVSAKESHHQFLDRASRWVDSVKKFRDDGIQFFLDDGFASRLKMTKNKSSGLPVLIASLDESLVRDEILMSRYEKIEDLIKSDDYVPTKNEEDIIAYIESAGVRSDGKRSKEFLKEFVATLTKENRTYLMDLLSRAE